VSDINIEFEWWELLLLSPMVGWPGIIAGGFAGALLWRKRPIVGALLGALVGNFLVALLTVYLM